MRNFGIQQTEQHSTISAVIFHAGALEPLGYARHAISTNLWNRFSNGKAEEYKRLFEGDSAQSRKIAPMRSPISLEVTAEVVPGLSEVAAARLGLHSWFILPNTTKLDQALFAHDTELEHIPRSLGFTPVKFYPESLKWKRQDVLCFIVGHFANRQAENR